MAVRGTFYGEKRERKQENIRISVAKSILQKLLMFQKLLPKEYTCVEDSAKCRVTFSEYFLSDPDFAKYFLSSMMMTYGRSFQILTKTWFCYISYPIYLFFCGLV